ncbi:MULTISPECIES: hypothetical protein [Acidobacteriaceae]|nr:MULTISPECIES: hypothetical protein [Acidobacteriaceae]MDW5266699.1 hypothetical protein [Edaphobacter sp.]
MPALRSTLHRTATLVRSRYFPRPPHAYAESLREFAQRSLTRRMGL